MIPVNEPLLGERELDYVTRCVRTGWISSAGDYISDFEEAWAAYCGMQFGVSVSSGTAALQVAMRCLDLQPGDEVVMPTFTIISCALAVVTSGGTPVLVDSDPRTWCMDVRQVEEKVSPRTRAIMAVHIYGHPVDMDPLLAIARRHNLALVEDAAEAHGAEYLSGHGQPDGTPAWRRCGGLSNISTFSFYANKPITTGEGGMVLTNDPTHAERARGLRNLCFRPERRFEHTELGYNFRLTNMQAAIGLAQVERIEKIVARKRWIGQAYSERLADIAGIQLPAEEPWARNVYWMYGVVLDPSTGLDAAELAGRLQAHGVETRPFFVGMHQQPVFLKQGLFQGERYPIAERLARQGLYLPSGLALTEGQINKVCDAVRRALVSTMTAGLPGMHSSVTASDQEESTPPGRGLQLSVLLPTYDERGNIAQLIERISAVVADLAYEIIVVDDDSPDGTGEIVRSLMDARPQVRLITRTGERGLVSAIQRGLAEATGDIVAWMDADLSQEPEYLPHLLEKISQGFDVAVASRYVPGGAMKGQDPARNEMSLLSIVRNLHGTVDSPIPVVMSWFGNWFLSKLLVPSFRDYTSGYIAVRRHVLERAPVEGYYGDYFIGLVYHAFQQGFRVVEVPYVILPRRHGKSKTGNNLGDFLLRGYQYLRATYRLRKSYARRSAPAPMTGNPGTDGVR